MEKSLHRHRRGCPHCGHSKIMEVISYRYKIGEDMGLPDEITKGRVPVFERITGPNGNLMDLKQIIYLEERKGGEELEKEIFFDGARFNLKTRDIH